MSTETRRNDVVSRAFADIDWWAEQCGALTGDGAYVHPDYIPNLDTTKLVRTGIQQVRAEIIAFVEVLVERDLRGSMFEIGLGIFGSTHRLWRHIFQRITTVEFDKENFDRFQSNMMALKYAEGASSHFIIGSSHDPSTVKAAYAAGQVDCVFIDGDHTYQGVLCDWLLYHNLARPGGIVAFHDSATTLAGEHVGVHKLLKELRHGAIDGVQRDVREIVFSKQVGIGYYVV